jgi:hypothetical protein
VNVWGSNLIRLLSATLWAVKGLRGLGHPVRPLGFEPRTCGLRVRCSAVELEARAMRSGSY